MLGADGELVDDEDDDEADAPADEEEDGIGVDSSGGAVPATAPVASSSPDSGGSALYGS